jgi:molybdate transport system regulatory protein
MKIEKVEATDHLSDDQLRALMESFREWFEKAPNRYIRRVRGRYWLTFLVLRFTGARIGEVLDLDDSLHVDFRTQEITVVSVKKKLVKRTVPIPQKLIADVATYLAEFPQMRGRVFALDQGNFRREFYKRAYEACIPKELAHPHILRHTRAIELLRAGVPVTIVQELLGHSVISITARYLRMESTEAKIILKKKGLL